jgi:hypothetical protein
MIDQGFCEFMEYEMCRFFSNSDIEEVKGFWCDGVLLSAPAVCYTDEFITDRKQASFKAYIGNDGQTQYDLVLKFGPQTMNRFLEGQDLEDCVSLPVQKESYNIDTVKKEIEIQLD